MSDYNDTDKVKSEGDRGSYQGSDGRKSPTRSVDSIGSAGSIAEKQDSPGHEGDFKQQNGTDSARNQRNLDHLRGTEITACIAFEMSPKTFNKYWFFIYERGKENC